MIFFENGSPLKMALRSKAGCDPKRCFRKRNNKNQMTVPSKCFYVFANINLWSNIIPYKKVIKFMKKNYTTLITFIISLIIGYIITGYIGNTCFVCIDWVVKPTLWQIIREYYIRTFLYNIIPALIMAIIPTVTVYLIKKKSKKN